MMKDERVKESNQQFATVYESFDDVLNEKQKKKLSELYDEICNMLYWRLGISEDKHIEKKAKFNPEISINNTQLYQMKDSFQEEANYIEHHLGRYCYDFPYVFGNSERKVF